MLHNVIILNGEDPGDPFVSKDSQSANAMIVMGEDFNDGGFFFCFQEETGEDIADAFNDLAFDDDARSEDEGGHDGGEENEDEVVQENRDRLWSDAKLRGTEKRLHITRNLPRLYF